MFNPQISNPPLPRSESPASTASALTEAPKLTKDDLLKLAPVGAAFAAGQADGLGCSGSCQLRKGSHPCTFHFPEPRAPSSTFGKRTTLEQPFMESASCSFSPTPALSSLLSPAVADAQLDLARFDSIRLAGFRRWPRWRRWAPWRCPSPTW